MCLYLYTEAHTHSCIQTHIHTYLRAETARRHYMYTLPYMYIWQVECVVYAQAETARRQCQKRPISVSKETYISVKRDLGRSLYTEEYIIRYMCPYICVLI